MRLGRTSWLILGIGIFVIAAVSLYMLYQGQVRERQAARDEMDEVQTTAQLLLLEKQDLENELAQKEDELDQWNDQVSQLEGQLAQAEIELGQTKDGFPGSAESIEYDEILFVFANDLNLEIVNLGASETSDANIDGINYTTTVFAIAVQGEVVNILDFVDTMVTDEAFKTAVLGPVNIVVPEPLSDEQKEDIEEGIREDLMAEAMTEITSEDILGFILEAVEEVTGTIVDVRTIEEMAETIRARIESSVEESTLELLPGDLAGWILEQISGSVAQEIVEPLAQEISDLILGVGEDETLEMVLEELLEADIAELLGADIAELLGEEIAGSMKGRISSLLNGYISLLIEEKMMTSAADVVEESVTEMTAETVEVMEMPSATMTLNIFTYEGE